MSIIKERRNQHQGSASYWTVVYLFLAISRFQKFFLIGECILNLIVGILEDLVVTSTACLLCHRLSSKLIFMISVFLSFMIIMDVIFLQMTGAVVTLSGLTLLLENTAILIQNLSMLDSIQLFQINSMICLVLFVNASAHYYRHKFLLNKKVISELFRFIIINVIVFGFIWGMSLFTLMSLDRPWNFTSHNIFIRLSWSMISRLLSNQNPEIALKKEVLLEEHLYLRNMISKTKPLSVAPPSIFIVFLESVRASSLPMYNKNIPKSFTPFLSKLVNQDSTLVVSDYVSSMPNTMKSLFSSMCGLPAYPNIQWKEYNPDSEYMQYCLPQLLSSSSSFNSLPLLNYSTRFYTSGVIGYQPLLGFDKSFGGKELFEFSYLKQKGMKNTRKNQTTLKGDVAMHERVSYLGYDERVMLTPVADWLNQLKIPSERHSKHHAPSKRRRRPAFGVFGGLSTHAPYTVNNKTRAKMVKPIIDDILSQQKQSSGINVDEYRKYLISIHDNDNWIESLYETIEKSQGEEGNYVFIVVGDHGEGFGEHQGSSFHGATLYQESVHIPLIISDHRKKNKLNRKQIKKIASERQTWCTLDLYQTLLSMIHPPLKPTTGNMEESLPLPETLPRPRNILARHDEKQYHLVDSQLGGDINPQCEVVLNSLLDDSMACITFSNPKFNFTKKKIILGGEIQNYQVTVYDLEIDPLERSPEKVLKWPYPTWIVHVLAHMKLQKQSSFFRFDHTFHINLKDYEHTLIWNDEQGVENNSNNLVVKTSEPPIENQLPVDRIVTDHAYCSLLPNRCCFLRIDVEEEEDNGEGCAGEESVFFNPYINIGWFDLNSEYYHVTNQTLFPNELAALISALPSTSPSSVKQLVENHNHTFFMNDTNCNLLHSQVVVGYENCGPLKFGVFYRDKPLRLGDSDRHVLGKNLDIKMLKELT